MLVFFTNYICLIGLLLRMIIVQLRAVSEWMGTKPRPYEGSLSHMHISRHRQGNVRHKDQISPMSPTSKLCTENGSHISLVRSDVCQRWQLCLFDCQKIRCKAQRLNVLLHARKAMVHTVVFIANRTWWTYGAWGSWSSPNTHQQIANKAL